MKRITAPDIIAMKRGKIKIAVLTAYNFHTAKILDLAGIPVILVGDSAGMVEAGMDTTLTVTVDELIYHTRSVARAVRRSLVVADMPFGSYQVSVVEAKKNAVRLVKEGGAQAVKVEGGKKTCEAVKAVVDLDIPVMGHIGLTPQSVHKFGGYKVQGKGRAEAKDIIRDARLLEKAGAFAIVLECIPAALAREVTKAVSVPTIGIGAGPYCDGQVLVINDMLGLSVPLAGSEKRPVMPRFVKKYADLYPVITKAVCEFKKEVEAGKFPSKEHCY